MAKLLRILSLAFSCLVIGMVTVQAQSGGALVVSSCGAASYTAGTARFPTVDTAGNLCSSSSGGAGGTSLADQAAFTYGATAFTPVGGVYNSSIAALSSGQAGAAALTAQRALHGTLYDEAGATFFTSTNPGYTTHPNVTASGNITSTQSVAVTPNSGESSIGIQVSGTWTGTLFVEGTVDGTNWVQTTTVPVFSGGVQTATITTNGAYQANLAGFAGFRIRGSTVASGTAVVTLIATTGTATVMADNPFQVTGYVGMTPLIVQGGAASGATLNGNPLRVGMSDGTNAQDWLAAIALGDGVNGNNTGAVGGWYYNGATWDRVRGDATNGAYVQVKTTALPLGITPTDRTITSATGASQTVMAANGSRHSLTIVNTGNANCGINPTGGTATIGGAGTLTLVPNGSYTPRVPTLSAVTAICTAAQPLYADEN